jgi:hypothetical protein
MEGADADTYAKQVIAAEIDGGHNGVVAKIVADAAAKGHAIAEPEIRAKMTELLAVAVAQVKAGI